MRVDLLLKNLCLVKTRSQGRKGCEAGAVIVNGRAAKPSTEAGAGDVVEIRYPARMIVVEIIEEPVGQASRKDASRYIRVIRESPRTGGGSGGFDV